MKTLTVGEVYYLVGFADRDLKFPCVKPLRFLGTNLFPDIEETDVTSYYFQNPAASPEDLEDESTSGKESLSLTEDGLSGIYTLIEAIAKLSLAAAGVDLTKPPGHRGLEL